MESSIDKMVNGYMNDFSRFLLPKQKPDFENWLCDNIQDDFYKGELVDIVTQAIQVLFFCKSNNTLINEYNYIINFIKKNQCSVGTFNEVIKTVAKFAKNGEKLYKMHHVTLNAEQQNFYEKIKTEHKDFYEKSKEKETMV